MRKFSEFLFLKKQTCLVSLLTNQSLGHQFRLINFLNLYFGENFKKFYQKENEKLANQ
jgi:hypothetical protein